MTKNSDTSPWMHFPDNPGAIKRHNELVLSSIPTTDLVTELKNRHELCPVVDEMTREPVCLCVMTTESLVNELSKRDGVEVYDVDGDFYLQRDGGGYKVRLYKSKLLVVRE